MYNLRLHGSVRCVSLLCVACNCILQDPCRTYQTSGKRPAERSAVLCGGVNEDFSMVSEPGQILPGYVRHSAATVQPDFAACKSRAALLRIVPRNGRPSDMYNTQGQLN